MPLIETTYGMLSDLARLLAAAPGEWRIGLYQPGFDPAVESDIDDVIPAAFSGYDGLHYISFWAAPILADLRAVAAAPPTTWTHDGGQDNCFVAGYYIVDSAGGLLRAEALPGDPVPVVWSGQCVTVIPRLSLGSRFIE